MGGTSQQPLACKYSSSAFLRYELLTAQPYANYACDKLLGVNLYIIVLDGSLVVIVWLSPQACIIGFYSLALRWLYRFHASRIVGDD